jgi:DNA polymerase IV
MASTPSSPLNVNQRPAQPSSDPAATTNDTLDLSSLPPIFVSATHFDPTALHELEDSLVDCGAALTYDLGEAGIVISKVARKPRVLFDLKAKGVWTEEVAVGDEADVEALEERVGKRIKVETESSRGSQVVVIDDDHDDSSTASEGEVEGVPKVGTSKRPPAKRARSTEKDDVIPSDSLIRVVKVDWFEESRRAGEPLPLQRFLTYQGRRVAKSVSATPSTSNQTTPRKPIHLSRTSSQPGKRQSSPTASILERAREDAPTHLPRADRFGRRKFGQHIPSSSGTASWEAGSQHQPHAHLLQKTTSEDASGISSDLPEMPEWVKVGTKYACQRLTPANPPNDAFISLLKKIKLARLLTNDEIGVRAYSTSIAALAAYPHKISNPREILALPGCDAKIANLYVEWSNTGTIKAVEDIEADEDLTTLRLFYEIWGVGATTAREFFYDKGWRDLDDIVEHGWKALGRVQQIGVKSYDEFLDPIPRAEVEGIAKVVHRHACKVRDDGIQSLVVGGYRRGKEASGDVDIIVSHPDEKKTLGLVGDIVASLGEEGWITHTLLLSLNSTNRGQETLPFRSGSGHGGHGFDTLDKALVVWQDPHWTDAEEATTDVDGARPSQAGGNRNNDDKKNPNIHRRVDIIVSPWRTVGCAVLGWSAGTTFERDLRRYAKDVKGWKFDSSGVRNRGNGEVVDLEGFNSYEGDHGKGRAETMLQAERRVFEGMGIEWREPGERCTG